MTQLAENLELDQGNTLADKAIWYLLFRINRDADLRWLFADTEAFHQLCLAQARLNGMPVDELKEKVLTPPRSLKDEKPRIPELGKRVAELEQQLEVADETFDDALTEDLYRATARVRQALDFCPACAGVPAESINRCDFCKAILRAIT